MGGELGVVEVGELVPAGPVGELGVGVDRVDLALREEKERGTFM